MFPAARNAASPAASSHIYRWVRIWLWVGGVLSLLLVVNSARDYLFVSHLIAVQQTRHEVNQRVYAFERDLRTNPQVSSRAALLTQELESLPDRAAWIVIRDNDGHVLEQAGTPERAPFTAAQEEEHFRTHEPLFSSFKTSRGPVVDEMFLVFPGPPRTPPAGAGVPGRGRRESLAIEIAMPVRSADAASLWPIRRNLLINIASAVALLLTVFLTWRGFRSYVRGKRLEQQVEIAREVQANLLPRDLRHVGGVELAVRYQPADEVAGDIYDVFETPRGVALVIGDVSGKGIPAALLMGVMHGAVRSSDWTSSAADHERETATLNRLLCERAAGAQFASMFWCVRDAAGILHYVNAGHLAPLLFHAGGDHECLATGGPVLGVLPAASYTQGRAAVQSGDLMVLYSDGLVEATNAAGDEFGERRLTDLLSQNLSREPEQILDAVVREVQAFLGGLACHDDLTCVIAKF